MPAPQSLLPTQNLLTPGTGYAVQDVSRQWKPIPHHTTPRDNSEFHQDSTSRYGTSGVSYLNPTTSSLSSVSGDGPLGFPALASLEKSLPLQNPNQNPNRTLPAPKSNKASIDSITNGNLGSVSESSASFIGVPETLGYKCNVSWDSEHAITSGFQDSMNSTDFSAPEGASDKISSSPRLSQDSANFGYIPLSAPHSSGYMQNILPDSTSSTENSIGLVDTNFPSGISSNTMLSNQSMSSNLYSYSIGTNGRNGSLTDSMASEGTLTNGVPYRRLRQPESNPSPTFDLLGKSSLEKSSQPSHRASISSIATRRYQ